MGRKFIFKVVHTRPHDVVLLKQHYDIIIAIYKAKIMGVISVKVPTDLLYRYNFCEPYEECVREAGKKLYRLGREQGLPKKLACGLAGMVEKLIELSYCLVRSS